jgi:hypothetical protein
MKVFPCLSSEAYGKTCKGSERRMRLRKTIIALLALLLAGVVMVPCVSAVPVLLPQLLHDINQDPVMVGNELSPEKNIESVEVSQVVKATKNPVISKIPYGSIIRHSKDGMTTVFDPAGKQLLITRDIDAKQVSTPEGIKPASRLHQVPDGSIIRTDGNVTTVYSDGERILTVLNPENSLVIPDFYGWIESSRDLSVSELGQFIAYWTVPTPPPSPQSDTAVFLFTGIQPSSGGIVQPVLEWNQAGSGGWTGRAWYVDQYGVGYYTSPISVNNGDSIKGTLSWNSNIQHWQIIFEDQSTGQSVSIFSENAANIGSANLQMYVVLEGNNVDDDTDVPGHTTFQNMRIRDVNLNVVDIDWVKRVETDLHNALTNLDVTWTSDTQVTVHTANA